MKIIALPDLHGGIEYLARIGAELSAVDVVLLVGDSVNGDRADGAAAVVEAMRRFNRNILAVPGNWEKDRVEAYLTHEGINLHRCHVVYGQIAFAGVGASLKSLIATPNEITEREFTSYLHEAVGGLAPGSEWILVCHQPPYQTVCDRTWPEVHVGSKAVRAFIEKTQPAICFTGHIHEAVGIDWIGSTQVVNPGPLWQGHYAYAEIDSRSSRVEIRRCPGAG